MVAEHHPLTEKMTRLFMKFRKIKLKSVFVPFVWLKFAIYLFFAVKKEYFKHQ